MEGFKRKRKNLKRKVGGVLKRGQICYSVVSGYRVVHGISVILRLGGDTCYSPCLRISVDSFIVVYATSVAAAPPAKSGWLYLNYILHNFCYNYFIVSQFYINLLFFLLSLIICYIDNCGLVCDTIICVHFFVKCHHFNGSSTMHAHKSNIQGNFTITIFSFWLFKILNMKFDSYSSF